MPTVLLAVVAVDTPEGPALDFVYPPDVPSEMEAAEASPWSEELRAALPLLVQPPRHEVIASPGFFFHAFAWKAAGLYGAIGSHKMCVVLLTNDDDQAYLYTKLCATAPVYFEQSYHDDYACLIELYDHLQSVDREPPLPRYEGLALLPVVRALGTSLLPLLRLLLVEGRIVFFSPSPTIASTSVEAFLSILPGGYSAPTATDAAQSYRWRKYGLPLRLVAPDHTFVVQPFLAATQAVAVYGSEHGFLVGACDPFPLLQTAAEPQVDAIVDVATGNVSWLSARALQSKDVSTDIAAWVTDDDALAWIGSEPWVRQQVQAYLEALLTVAANPPARRTSFTDLLFRPPAPLEAEHGADWLERWRCTYNYDQWRMAHSLREPVAEAAPKTGHGRYSYPSGDEYVGTFRDGKRHGHGTYTAAATKYSYCGGWVDDRRHGEGTLNTGQGSYRGAWQHDERCGHGTLTWGDRLSYVGEWRANVYHGAGVLIDGHRGWRYDGEFALGRPHGVGKAEYTKDAVVVSYSGEWQHGRFHGVGAATYRDGSVYAGDFANGERQGVGVWSNTAGDAYDGDWCHDQRHGFGMSTSGVSKETKEGPWKANAMVQGRGKDWVVSYPTGDKYSGELQQGRPWGRGTCRYANGAVYAGEWVDGHRQGNGVFVDVDGSTIDGVWANGQPAKENSLYVEIPLSDDECVSGVAATDGATTVVYPNGDEYVGALRKGKRHGRGKFTAKATRHTYDGDWDMDLRHGQGVLTSGTRDFVYDGTWVQNTRTGFGTCVLSGIESYSGMWHANAFHGHGTFSDADGGVYVGEFAHGLKHGVGKYSAADGTTYHGEYAHGERSGTGTCTEPNGDVYTGGFLQGQRHGEGSFVTADFTFVGTWSAGLRHGPGVLTQRGTVKEGTWQLDAPVDGDWTIRFPTQSVYTGACVGMRPHGHGICKYANGDVYSGNWERSGWGVCVFANGDVFDGEWTHNHVSLTGRGTLTLANGTVHAYTAAK
ncbi:hypothetical protein ACHHYP_12616 [Achlya hypogyna]|uniref:AVL9/DENND6 domain-containing protein n=1 Tax=Achlya hypogyna TaxID=1202772 RepID=A0A1V9ZGR9_ACHHY|nr:hypothetical protein ACHHYP_12616 [Achlya hypogyna]